MIRQRPPELFGPERPIRSEYSEERIYARRRVMTVIVLALIIGGVAYGMWGRHAVDPNDIPTVAGEGDYKQRPTEPGGIDIPHQDVQVYDKLENKSNPGTPAQGVEHLLPPPEAPAAPPVATPTSSASADMPVPQAAPAQGVQQAASKPPVSLLDDSGAAGKTVTTTVAPSVVPSGPVGTAVPSPPPETDEVAAQPAPVAAPAPVAPPVASKASTAAAKPTSIDDILKRTQQGATKSAVPAAPTAAATASSGASAGSSIVQLASVPDQAKAQKTMDELRKKYAADLSGVTLRLVKADLGAKGVYYRVQSQGLAEDKATRLCAAMKQKGASCFLVRK